MAHGPGEGPSTYPVRRRGYGGGTPAPRGGRGGNPVTGQTAIPGGTSTHVPTPVPPANSGYPSAPAPSGYPAAPAPHPVNVPTPTHPALATLPPAEAALIHAAISAAQTYGIKPATLLGALPSSGPPSRSLTLTDIAHVTAHAAPTNAAPHAPAAAILAGRGAPIPQAVKAAVIPGRGQQALARSVIAHKEGPLPPLGRVPGDVGQPLTRQSQRGLIARAYRARKTGRRSRPAPGLPWWASVEPRAANLRVPKGKEKSSAPLYTNKHAPRISNKLLSRNLYTLTQAKGTPGRVSQADAAFLDPNVAAKAKRFAAGGKISPALLKGGPVKTLAALAARAQAQPSRTFPIRQQKAGAQIAGGFGIGTIKGGKRLVASALVKSLAGTKKHIGKFYVDPFKHTAGLVKERIDQGKDFSAADGQPIDAIGKGEVLSIGASGWPGADNPRNGITYKLLEGPHAGQEVFVRESMSADPNLKVGSVVQRGQQIATFQTPPSGQNTGIEMGFAAPAGDAANSVLTPYNASDYESDTPGGHQFARFYHKVVTGHVAGGNLGAGGGGNVPPLTSPAVAHAVNHTLARVNLPGNPRARQLVTAAVKYGRQYGVSPALIVSISQQESNVGTSTLPGVRSGQNGAGAAGPMQMGNGTGASGDAWQTYSQQIWGAKAGQHSVYNIPDAVQAAALYLKAAGAPASIADTAAAGRAALAYNHSQVYADTVVTEGQAYKALDAVNGHIGSLGHVSGAVASAAASGTVPLGSAGAIGSALAGAPAGIRSSFAQSHRAAQAQAARSQQAMNRARGYITPPTGITAQSPFAFGYGGDYQAGATGSGGSFRPSARRRSSR